MSNHLVVKWGQMSITDLCYLIKQNKHLLYESCLTSVFAGSFSLSLLLVFLFVSLHITGPLVLSLLSKTQHLISPLLQLVSRETPGRVRNMSTNVLQKKNDKVGNMFQIYSKFKILLSCIKVIQRNKLSLLKFYKAETHKFQNLKKAAAGWVTDC